MRKHLAEFALYFFVLTLGSCVARHKRVVIEDPPRGVNYDAPVFQRE